MNESKSTSTDEFGKFKCCIEEFASLIGDTFGDEMLKISGELEAKPVLLGGCRHVTVFGGKSNCDFFIGGMGLNGESRPVEYNNLI